MSKANVLVVSSSAETTDAGKQEISCELVPGTRFWGKASKDPNALKVQLEIVKYTKPETIEARVVGM